MDIASLLKDWGSAGMVIFVVILFLRDTKAVRESFNTIMANHLEHAADKHKEGADVMKEAAGLMAAALDRLNQNCQRRMGAKKGK